MDFESATKTANNVDLHNATLHSYIIVDSIGKDGFLTRYTFKTTDLAKSFLQYSNLDDTTINKQVFPEKYGLFATKPDSQISIMRHIRGEKPSPYVSASNLPSGSATFKTTDISRLNINNKKQMNIKQHLIKNNYPQNFVTENKLLYIDIEKLRKSGAILITTDELIEELTERKNHTTNIKKIQEIDKFIKNVKRDKEVLIRDSKQKSSSAVFTKQGKSYAQAIIVGEKILLPISIFFSVENITQATYKSIQTNNPKPIIKASSQEIGGWTCAWL